MTRKWECRSQGSKTYANRSRAPSVLAESEGGCWGCGTLFLGTASQLWPCALQQGSLLWPASHQAHNCTTTPIRYASSIHFISYFHSISLSPFTVIISKSWTVSKQVHQNGPLLGDKIAKKTSEITEVVLFCFPRRNEYKPRYHPQWCDQGRAWKF